MRARAPLALMLAALVAATPALAQRWGARGGWGGGGGRRGAAMGPGPGMYGGGPRGGAWGGGPRGAGWGGGGYRRRGDWASGDGYAGAPMGAAYGPQRPAQAFRRGQIVPQDYRGARVADPGRYHLRGAPNGYDWLGDGRDAYLVQRSTGMVMDSAPGAYQGPGPGGRGGRWRRNGPGY